jgi:putative FmdB family regulatory protein
MPIYEYRCRQCGQKSSFLLLSVKSQFEARCQHCGSLDLVRLISRVAVLRSEEQRLESLADPSRLGDLDENDPQSLARWMKKFGREMGDELGPDFNEEIDRALAEAEKTEGGEEFPGEEPEPSFSANDSDLTPDDDRSESGPEADEV